MTTITLLQSVNFSDVWKVLQKEYYYNNEDIQSYKDKYLQFYNYLCSLAPKNSQKQFITTYIRYYGAFEENTIDHCVVCYCCDDDKFYSLMFKEWSEVLSYTICEKSRHEYGAVAFAAHLLYELSFFGFDEDTVQKEKQKLYSANNKIRNQKMKTIVITYKDTRTSKEKEKEEKWMEKSIELNNVIANDFKDSIKKQLCFNS